VRRAARLLTPVGEDPRAQRPHPLLAARAPRHRGLVALIHQHEDEIIVELDEGLRGGTALLAPGSGR
jgi:hypothetical protein